jgi:hypothetical protein
MIIFNFLISYNKNRKNKKIMGYYDNILKLLSLALTFAILFIVIYGCQFKRYRYVEGFTNEGEEPEKKEEKGKIFNSINIESANISCENFLNISVNVESATTSALFN